MVEVLAPRAGPVGLIASLAKWGIKIIDVVASPSVGALGQFNVSDGAGGWQSTPARDVGGDGSVLELPYDSVEFSGRSGGGDVSSGINVQEVRWRAAQRYVVQTGDPSAVAMQLELVAGLSRSPGRLLVSGDPGGDAWSDPQTANNFIVSTVVNLAVDAATVSRVETTVLCAAGGLTITLPSPVGRSLRKVTVKDRFGFAGATPGLVNVSGGSTIDGAASINLNVNYQALNFQCDGTNWFRV
jgi:hypothetical protein